MEHQWYTVNEIAERLKVSRWTVSRWIKAGTLPAVQLGSTWRVRDDDLDRFLEEQAKKAVA